MSPQNNKFSELRKNAENKIKKLDPTINKGKEKHIQDPASEIEHELNVHKVELEMQNEELLIAQSQLAKSLEEYTNLFDYAPVGYFILDKNGAIMNVNQTGANQLGLIKKQLTGKHLSSFFSSQSYQDEFYRQRNLAIETGKTLQVECEIKCKDEHAYFALIEMAIVNDMNEMFKHLLVTVSDISLQKKQEYNLHRALIKEKELNEMKSRFVTMASHEFRTPLAAILTSSDIIRIHVEKEEFSKSRKHIDRIKSSVSNLTEILNNFLLIDKLEQNNIQFTKERVEVKKLVHFAIEDAERTLKPGQQIEYVHSGKNQMKMDKTIFSAILINLLSNAGKFSEEGKKIELKTIISDNKIIIQVKDYGIGIPLNEQEQIFSRFFRTKEAEMIGGIGLGLTIVKKYVELLDGNIRFTSKENEGSVFTVELSI